MPLKPSALQVNFVVALNSEARALIQHYGLKPQLQQPFKIFSADKINLIVSGVGQTAAAAAVGFLSAYKPHPLTAWFNVGVAGHRDADIGQGFIVHELIDDATERVHYPSVSFRSALPSATLRTVTAPQTDYPHDTLYDMEGVNFFEAACRFTSIELITLIKIVSDNRHHPIENISKALLHELVTANLPAIEEITNKFRKLAGEIETTNDAFIDDWLCERHATATQQLALLKLHQRLKTLAPEVDTTNILANCNTSADAIALLEQTLRGKRLKLS